MLSIAAKYDLKDYRNPEFLDKGLFGKVYQVSSRVNHKFKYAVKVVDITSDGVSKKLENEETLHKELTLAASQSPTPCYILDFLGSACDESNGQRFISLFLELAPHGTLTRYIPSNGFASHVAARYFCQLVSALKFMHDLHIVHGDVKPDNMLMDEKYQLKLADFNLSRRQNDSTKAVAPGYTANYAAPEVLQKMLIDGFAADAWAAGITLFELLAGRCPWKRAERMDPAYLKWTRGQLEDPWTTINQEEIDSIRPLLSEDPECRATIEMVWEVTGPNRGVIVEEAEPMETSEPSIPSTPEGPKPKRGIKRAAPENEALADAMRPKRTARE